MQLCEEVKKIFYAIMRKDRWDNIVVHFDDMKLGDQGTIAAAECLKRNERVEEMSLRRCAVGQMGAGEVAKSLKYNDKLFILDLSENEITMAGISTVCKHLTENNNVASFSISQCKLTDRGAKSVSFLMLAERKIRKLDISNNEITEKGFGQLAMVGYISTPSVYLHFSLLYVLSCRSRNPYLICVHSGPLSPSFLFICTDFTIKGDEDKHQDHRLGHDRQPGDGKHEARRRHQQKIGEKPSRSGGN